MPIPSALELLIELAANNSDKEARNLGQALALESSQTARLELLNNYRREYLGSFDRARRAGLTATALINFYNFLQKLDSAIEQQKVAVTQVQAQTAQVRVDLRVAEIKRKSLETIQERRVAVEKVTEARRDRRTEDEIATRIAVHGTGLEAGRR
jgi:flagellar protein FliJ